MRLRYGERFVSFDEVPPEYRERLLKQVLEYLGLTILAAETPDYQSYTLLKTEE